MVPVGTAARLPGGPEKRIDVEPVSAPACSLPGERETLEDERVAPPDNLGRPVAKVRQPSTLDMESAGGMLRKVASD